MELISVADHCLNACTIFAQQDTWFAPQSITIESEWSQLLCFLKKCKQICGPARSLTVCARTNGWRKFCDFAFVVRKVWVLLLYQAGIILQWLLDMHKRDNIGQWLDSYAQTGKEFACELTDSGHSALSIRRDYSTATVDSIAETHTEAFHLFRVGSGPKTEYLGETKQGQQNQESKKIKKDKIGGNDNAKTDVGSQTSPQNQRRTLPASCWSVATWKTASTTSLQVSIALPKYQAFTNIKNAETWRNGHLDGFYVLKYQWRQLWWLGRRTHASEDSGSAIDSNFACQFTTLCRCQFNGLNTAADGGELRH